MSPGGTSPPPPHVARESSIASVAPTLALPTCTALAAAIEQARAVEVPTEVIDEAATVLKEAMKLQDRIVP